MATYEESQGDHLMARKLAKQQGRGIATGAGGGYSGIGASGAAGGMVARHGGDDSTDAACLAVAAAIRQQRMPDASTTRKDSYNAWPSDVKAMRQQVQLLKEELDEKEHELARAQTNINVMTIEMQQLRKDHELEMQRVKAENLSQLIHTFRQEGMKGLEGLAKMQGLGQFAMQAEKDRLRWRELEGAAPHRDLEKLQREYEHRLTEMKQEYEAKLLAQRKKHALQLALGDAAHARQPSGLAAAQRTHPPALAARPSRDGITLASQPSGNFDMQGHKVKTEALARGYYARMGY